jgi:hypothetical protein
MITQNELAPWPSKVATGANIEGLLHGIRLSMGEAWMFRYFHSLAK